MTRFWPQGAPIKVSIDDVERPRALVWQGDRHAVWHHVKRWRVDDGWWTERVWREYYTLTTRSGLLLVVYQDLLAGDWHLQRVYD